MLERSNLQAALKRVRQNKGSPGIDGMTVDELPDYLRAHWSELREHLLSGAYRPSMVKQQLIPKGNGEMRKLGIPTVLDRFIQQALLQVLQPMFDPGFSDHSLPGAPIPIGHARRDPGLLINVDIKVLLKCSRTLYKIDGSQVGTAKRSQGLFRVSDRAVTRARDWR